MDKGTKEDPWRLKTPPGSSSFEIYIDEYNGLKALVCTVGRMVLYYDFRIIKDLHHMLKKRNTWVLLGSKDEKATTTEGTVEHWARSSDNPIGGWYGLKKGFRGRVGMYIPPLMERLGLAEVEHKSRNNRMQAIQ